MTTCLQGVSKCFFYLLHELLLGLDPRLVSAVLVFLGNNFLQIHVVSRQHIFFFLSNSIFSVLIDRHPVRLLCSSDCYHSAVTPGPHLQVAKVYRSIFLITRADCGRQFVWVHRSAHRAESVLVNRVAHSALVHESSRVLPQA